MNENYQAFYWSKLDNAAKLYAMVSSSKVTNVFRTSVKLKGVIEKADLEMAVAAALDDMPSFKVRVRTGFFWYYFDSNFQKSRIREEYTYPCSKITKFINNGYLFNITYFEKMIHLEVFHTLADGTGAVQFLKLIVQHYVRQHYKLDFIIEDNDGTQSEKDEDSFLKYEGKSATNSILVTTKAYRVSGIRKKPQELKVIHGRVSTKKVIQLAQQHHVSVTSFLCAVLIAAIYHQNFKCKGTKQPITVTIPMNLRTSFDSKTVRNFFLNATIKVTPAKDFSFEWLLDEVSRQLKENQKEEALEAQMNEYVSIQKRLAVRFVPLVIKNLVMRSIYFQADKGVTITISNLGRIDFSQEVNQYVEEASFLLPVTTHQPIRCGIISQEDRFVISFTSALEETNIQKFFFQCLKKYGLDVTIYGNEEINHEILS
ncbi:hypothetical protein [Peribacillus sp. NPDC058002]|uniref:hypothetical protein n=1 Tax=Peribacillus sp. NPDC058002 TaxID=3346301 RepID=UPI0036DD02D5